MSKIYFCSAFYYVPNALETKQLFLNLQTLAPFQSQALKVRGGGRQLPGLVLQTPAAPISP